MRLIQFPDKNIQIVDPLTGALGDFIAPMRWLLTCIVNDQRMGSSPLQTANVVRIVEKAKAFVLGQPLKLADEEYDALKPIVEQPAINVFPQTQYQPLLMAQLEPYRRAVLDAQYINDAKAKAEKK